MASIILGKKKNIALFFLCVAPQEHRASLPGADVRPPASRLQDAAMLHHILFC